MAGDLTITLEGWDRLDQAFRQAPDIVRQEFDAYMHAATQHMQSEVVDRTPAAMGTLRASIHGSVERMADGVLGVVGTAQPYAIPVELGTKPHFPPVLAIQDWVRVKLGKTGKEGRSVAFAIARKISKVGTKGHFMFRDAFQHPVNQAELQRQFDAAGERILARLAGAA